MIKELKLQNEVKIKLLHVSRTDPGFRTVEELVQKLFKNINFDENKDWNISVNIKNNIANGLRELSGTLKMTDRMVTGEQLLIFEESEQLSIMPAVEE